jgi:hypothetical protein
LHKEPIAKHINYFFDKLLLSFASVAQRVHKLIKFLSQKKTVS